EPIALDAFLGGDGPKPGGQIAAAELERGNVHSNGERGPLPDTAAGEAESVLAKLLDQAAFLRDRNHFDGGKIAELAITPAQQAFDRMDFARRIELRLIMELDRAAMRQGLAQLALDDIAALDGGVHLVAENLIAVPAQGFGAVHGDVGLADQLRSDGFRIIDKHGADACANPYVLAADNHRLAYRLDNALAQMPHVGLRSDMALHDGEF